MQLPLKLVSSTSLAMYSEKTNNKGGLHRFTKVSIAVKYIQYGDSDTKNIRV